MWIFLADSFLSIVQPQHNTADARNGRLIVRARVKGDIERVFPTVKGIATKGRDYAFRASIPRIVVADAMHTLVMGITATNFKDTVKEKDRSATYLRVWSVMNDLQDSRGHGGLYNEPSGKWVGYLDEGVDRDQYPGYDGYTKRWPRH